jgi:glutathione S-transferase
VLYSFRRCPYAIRARMAIAYAGIQVELREVILRHKPKAMLAISPKGTVPVLQLNNGEIIDESIDIMHWALSLRDQDGWLDKSAHAEAGSADLIKWNDGEFKNDLDRYKYADRFADYERNRSRYRAETFLKVLERRLATSQFLCGAKLSVTDVAIFPFIRQFAAVDKDWFDESPYSSLRRWLNDLKASDLFARVMKKYRAWCPAEGSGAVFGREADDNSIR